MKIQDYSIEKLIPYEFNNKKHNQKQVDRVANSIKEFGFNQPIVIDENNIILVGHARHLASLKLGLKEVPVLIKTELSEIKKKAYRILDNKLSDDSDWDFDNLNLELDFLEDNDFNLIEWGLDELRIDEGNQEVIEENQNVEMSSNFRIEIICMSEFHQKEIYEKLKKEGLECRLLTL